MIIKGYNCKQFVMASTLLERMSSFVPTEDRFTVFRDEVSFFILTFSLRLLSIFSYIQIQRALSNIGQNKPYTRAVMESDYILELDMWTALEQLEAVKTLTFQTFFEFVSNKLFEVTLVFLSLSLPLSFFLISF